MNQNLIAKIIKSAGPEGNIEVTFKQNHPAQTAGLYGMNCAGMINFKNPSQLKKINTICKSNKWINPKDRSFSVIIKEYFDLKFFLNMARYIESIKIVR